MNTQKLYRPVGLKELELIADAGWNAFPPRLDWQPIFYPVLNEAYATQIAEQWNTGDEFSGYCGVVTCFEVDKEYIARYATQNVGGELHDELWVPAEELVEFNKNIIGKIAVVNAFFGAAFIMPENIVIKEILKRFKHEDL